MSDINTSVLILAGGTLKSKFDYIKMSSECPALLPINCKSISSYIISFYSLHKNCKIYLATNKRYEEEIKEELGTFDFDFEFIFMPDTDNVISSLSYSLSQIPKNTESVIVNLVTTIPTVFPNLNDIQFSQSAIHSNLWSGYVNVAGENKIIYKKANESHLPFHAFTGVFHLKYDKIFQLVESGDLDKSDLFSIFKNENWDLYKISMCDWLDCGHEVNYYDTKTKLISSRSFNNISFSERGIVRKKSTNAAKLKDEAQYFKLLPSSVSILFPRLITDFYIENNKGVYELEFYGYPNVAELILFWDLSPDILRRMFYHFGETLNQFKKYPSTIAKEDFFNFYLGKLEKRVKEYHHSLSVEDIEIITNEIIVNGKTCLPLAQLNEFIYKKIEALYDEKDFCIMHGDFCYNNILYDVSTGITKLIDPRGSFSEESKGIYGDRKYDFAKLAHSAIGGYDFFVNNKYKMSRNANIFEYSFGSKKHDLTSQLMVELIENNNYNYNDIKFIMGTLFISMCPLHSDSPKRQMTFYVHGLKILNEVFEAETH